MHEYFPRLKRLIKISEKSRDAMSNYVLLKFVLVENFMISYKKNNTKIEFHN